MREYMEIVDYEGDVVMLDAECECEWEEEELGDVCFDEDGDLVMIDVPREEEWAAEALLTMQNGPSDGSEREQNGPSDATIPLRLGLAPSSESRAEEWAEAPEEGSSWDRWLDPQEKAGNRKAGNEKAGSSKWGSWEKAGNTSGSSKWGSWEEPGNTSGSSKWGSWD